MPQAWIPKHQKAKRDPAPRLVGCPAFPGSGVIAGANQEWCQASQGPWCDGYRHNSKNGRCPWRRNG
jgi:hypothetical protein